MGQILHGCATTKDAVRSALQRLKASLNDLAEQHGLNPMTVAKWRKRAFVLDAARGLSRSARADFALVGLEQALHEHRHFSGDGLVCHANCGSQYVSIRYIRRFAEAGVQSCVGGVGDSYDIAHTETVIGLFKTEVIHRGGPCRSLMAVEFATFRGVDWSKTRRPLEPIGNTPPAEAETRYYAHTEAQALAA